MTGNAEEIARESRPDMLRRLAREIGRTPAERGALNVAASLMERAFAPLQPKPARRPDYYRLDPVWVWREGDRGEPPMMTAAIVRCAITGKTLAGMGGPALAIDPDLLSERIP
ncbi:hypothetical protein [Roseomonas chloroacetimidivorans]|uniref:hypothetical protein n=1 Tax=Roseomonas chloroacetimidivorans TaxID=1766656 RepID=UPI003C757D54